MTGAEFVPLLTGVLTIASHIIDLAGRAQRNREKCKLLGLHVTMIRRLLSVLKESMTVDVWLEELLKNLKEALTEGLALVESCQDKRTWSRVFKTQKKAKKIDAIGQRISMILDSFNLANTILIGSVNKERFFLNVLRKLLEDGACKRLPQKVKDELKSSVMKLTNVDNMSSEAREILEWIKKDITYSDAATSGSSRVQTGDILIEHIVEKTKEIMNLAAQSHKNDDIKRLAHLVQQVGNIIQDPQTSELSLDGKMRPTLEELKQDLDRICDNLFWYNRMERSKVKRAMLCGPDNADEVLKDAYQIEYYIPVLPAIALQQQYERNSL